MLEGMQKAQLNQYAFWVMHCPVSSWFLQDKGTILQEVSGNHFSCVMPKRIHAFVEGTEKADKITDFLQLRASPEKICSLKFPFSFSPFHVSF